MRNTPTAVPWSLLALVASVGCHDTDTLLPDQSEVELESQRMRTTRITIPESWAEGWENRDHCAAEERLYPNKADRPPPWESYCHNPRPLRTGLITAESYWEERMELKREWDERHGLTPLGAESK